MMIEFYQIKLKSIIDICNFFGNLLVYYYNIFKKLYQFVILLSFLKLFLNTRQTTVAITDF